jgi:hypothetical protein
VFTVTAALEYAVAARQGHGTRLSVEFLNWAGHRAAGRSADGGFFSELWHGYEKYGICPEEEQPYQEQFDPALEPGAQALHHAERFRELGLKLHWIKEWDVHTGLTATQVTEIKAALAAGRPVCGGFRWPNKPAWHDGVLGMCGPADVFDGHSVLLVGYKDDPAQAGGGTFSIRNSGGDGSDGALPYDYAAAFMNDAAWIDAGK